MNCMSLHLRLAHTHSRMCLHNTHYTKQLSISDKVVNIGICNIGTHIGPENIGVSNIVKTYIDKTLEITLRPNFVYVLFATVRFRDCDVGSGKKSQTTERSREAVQVFRRRDNCAEKRAEQTGGEQEFEIYQ